MDLIQKCNAYKIKDSRGEETLEVEMSAGEFTVWASVPAGKSTGSREAISLSADDSIKNINEIIAPQLIGKKVNITTIDDFLVSLDGTKNKSNLGANAILGISIAVLKLEAKIANQPLWKYISTLVSQTSDSVVFPRLFVNVLNGGVHADFKLPFQEYMFVLGNGMNIVGPINQLETLFDQLKGKLKVEEKEIEMGDEGGFSFKSGDIEEPFKILSELHNSLAIDVAGGEFFENDKYNVIGKKYSTEELSGIYQNLVKKFPLISIEDPFSENDFNGFKNLVTGLLKDEVLVVGDDLTTTNPQMIEKSIERGLINAVLIKPNQIGTITETLKAIEITHQAGLKTIISHRSGETNDSFIADLAVGVGAYGLKSGTMHQAEREVKYDRLIEIEKELQISQR
ncbi:MAG: phosphopyruvate hydratase [Candidatus Pacebacteria bacterium]|nr:phosphopyruvate hydratase [Candidatus Paceibacterota bacterium]